MQQPEENAYQLLGLDKGPETTEAEIKKAYRKLALIKHPDKNPNNPNAADEFAALQRAYDILIDEEARAALDNLLKAKAVREEQTAFRSEKRRKMAEELQARENQADRQRNDEQNARDKLQQEIERLRKRAAERQAAKHQQQQSDVEPEHPMPSFSVSAGVDERLARTIKLSWTRSLGDYTAAKLRECISEIAPVEDIVMRDGKKKKGSALAVLVTVEGATAVVHSVVGDVGNPLLITPLAAQRDSTAPPAMNHPQSDTIAPLPPRPASFPTFPSAGSGPSRLPGGLGARPTAPLFAAAAAAKQQETNGTK